MIQQSYSRAYIKQKLKTIYMHPYVHCHTIHIGQDMETTQILFIFRVMQIGEKLCVLNMTSVCCLCILFYRCAVRSAATPHRGYVHLKQRKMKVQFLTCNSHISSTQQLHVAKGYSLGNSRVEYFHHQRKFCRLTLFNEVLLCKANKYTNWELYLFSWSSEILK